MAQVTEVFFSGQAITASVGLAGLAISGAGDDSNSRGSRGDLLVINEIWNSPAEFAQIIIDEKNY